MVMMEIDPVAVGVMFWAFPALLLVPLGLMLFVWMMVRK